MTTSTTATRSNQQPAGFPPAPPEAHQRADVQFKVQAYMRHPATSAGDDEGNCVDVEIASTRTQGSQTARAFLAVGYFVEVFAADGEMLAGTFEPYAVPKYIL